eukprot:TRINITY_DN342_c7_g1_i1.p1 TRINITY_DN342_c7_g1~~TRINITY_DN342_c7_g1_i1.p1  ORF type:complete len:368 (+),score=75.30 TRINITY_DN342_c7_g1_i1:50-1105(+)
MYHQVATRRHSPDRAKAPPPPAYYTEQGEMYRRGSDAAQRRGSYMVSTRRSSMDMEAARRSQSVEASGVIRRMSNDGLVDELLRLHKEDQYAARVREFERDRMLDELLKRNYSQRHQHPHHHHHHHQHPVDYPSYGSGYDDTESAMTLSRHASRESLNHSHTAITAETVRGSEVEVDLGGVKHTHETYHVHLKNGRECEACKQVYLEKEERLRKLEKKKASGTRVPAGQKIANPDSPKPLPKPLPKPVARPLPKPRAPATRRVGLSSSQRSQTAYQPVYSQPPAAVSAYHSSPKRVSPVSPLSSKSSGTTRIRTWRDNTTPQRLNGHSSTSSSPRKPVVKRRVIPAPNIKA